MASASPGAGTTVAATPTSSRKSRHVFGAEGEFHQTRKEALGSGSFATVYEGVNNKTGERVAIKKVKFAIRTSLH